MTRVIMLVSCLLAAAVPCFAQIGAAVDRRQAAAIGHQEVAIGPKQDEPVNPPQCEFELLDRIGRVVATTRSDARGAASFAHIAEGAYFLAIKTPRGRIIVDAALHQVPAIPPSPKALGAGDQDAGKPMLTFGPRPGPSMQAAIIIETGIIVIGGRDRFDSLQQARATLRQAAAKGALAVGFQRQRDTLSIVVQGG